MPSTALVRHGSDNETSPVSDYHLLTQCKYWHGFQIFHGVLKKHTAP